MIITRNDKNLKGRVGNRINNGIFAFDFKCELSCILLKMTLMGSIYQCITYPRLVNKNASSGAHHTISLNHLQNM